MNRHNVETRVNGLSESRLNRIFHVIFTFFKQLTKQISDSTALVNGTGQSHINETAYLNIRSQARDAEDA